MTLRELSASLAARRNADRGWGYGPGKASRLEATCWSLLAISKSSGAASDVRVLLDWRQQDGWLVDVPGAPVNFGFNALAAITLNAHPEGVDAGLRIARQLLGVKGVKFDQNREIRQDNSLQAWPWIDGTFSWAEPTSLCLLAIKKFVKQLPAAEALERISVAERMLSDRSCSPGGWNYGGSNAFGQDLPAYVPTTAIALLALQDRPLEPVVRRAVDWLKKEAREERSAQSLALATLALQRHREPIQVLQTGLAGRMNVTSTPHGTLGLACSLYALSPTDNGPNVFTL